MMGDGGAGGAGFSSHVIAFFYTPYRENTQVLIWLNVNGSNKVELVLVL
jgi:hypothetical protein